MLVGLETNGGEVLACASGGATILQALGTGAHTEEPSDPSTPPSSPPSTSRPLPPPSPLISPSTPSQYINGHSDVLMGAVILPNAFTAEANNNKDTIDAPYTRPQFLQNAHGAVPGAFDAWPALRGAKLLSLRMKEQGRSAIKLAPFLFAHPRVKEVLYPGLAEHPGHNNAAKILASHALKFFDELGWIGELVDDGAAERFLTWTRLFTLAEGLGGVESLVELPEKVTHGVNIPFPFFFLFDELIVLQSIPPAERLVSRSVTPNLVRLSVGVEDVDDLTADVEQALSWTVDGWNSASISLASSDSE
ncbi:hypothetical protein M422DRAFT_267243 [Sphaerobolus stellatus SS14]|uniref:cystathionine gamma-lyase n=1 Tax=Sphaerobolus stellatus (strain SS14) TaxID=990650 RepID=A0A0C9TMG6_SPHS4|nr:hypothetical protein M422DRAFT_267243 [Sphaerobolus stellatus SS14]